MILKKDITQTNPKVDDIKKDITQINPKVETPAERKKRLDVLYTINKKNVKPKEHNIKI
jgi:hypothetical protein